VSSPGAELVDERVEGGDGNPHQPEYGDDPSAPVMPKTIHAALKSIAIASEKAAHHSTGKNGNKKHDRSAGGFAHPQRCETSGEPGERGPCDEVRFHVRTSIGQHRLADLPAKINVRIGQEDLHRERGEKRTMRIGRMSRILENDCHCCFTSSHRESIVKIPLRNNRRAGGVCRGKAFASHRQL